MPAGCGRPFSGGASSGPVPHVALSARSCQRVRDPGCAGWAGVVRSFHEVSRGIARRHAADTDKEGPGPANRMLSRLVLKNKGMEILRIRLRGGRAAEVSVIGPEDGASVMYFHSPATSGEEMAGAAAAATGHHLRVISVRRPSIVCEAHDEFVETVAIDAGGVVEALGLDRPALLAWSGGAPYALAAAAHLGHRASLVHLASPVPGPLTGSDAVPNLSDRLRQVARTTQTSSWATSPEALRDYRAVAAPWAFDLGAIAQHVTIWSPTEDQIVPLHLSEHLRHRLPSAEIVEVVGAHDWLITNWATALERVCG